MPSVAHWRLAGLPRALEAGQAHRLLASCDRRTAMGRRDFAILTFCWSGWGCAGARSPPCGLRKSTGWPARSSCVARATVTSGCRCRPMSDRPLLDICVAGVLRAPKGAACSRAPTPHRALSPDGVKGVVVRAGRRAGLGSIGSHRLRHTAATEMLRAGASLPEIGQALRHRSIESTAIYAKVDRDALRSLARPWIGGGA